MERTQIRIEEQLRIIASRQHGVVTRRQAAVLGLPRHATDWLVRSGRWRAETGGVLVLEGSPETDLQTAVRGVLGAGRSAALSHNSAAAFWSIPGFRLHPTHVLVGYARPNPPRTTIQVHRSRRVLPEHLTVVDGITLTTPARTVFDLSGVLRPLRRVEALLDHAWAQRLVGYRSMMEVIDQMSGRGQRNVAQLRELVQTRGSAYIAGDSALERRFHWILSQDGQEPMERQVDLSDDEGWWGRVDAADRRARLLVEIDGDRWHSTVTDRANDEERRDRARASGYRILRFAENDVWHRPWYVADEVRRARRGHRLDRANRAA